MKNKVVRYQAKIIVIKKTGTFSNEVYCLENWKAKGARL